MSQATAVTHPPLRLRVAAFVALVLAAVASDQATKMAALSGLSDGQTVPLLGDVLTLHLIRNSGAAFSLGANTTWIFTILAVVILAVLVWGFTKVKSWQSVLAIGLLAGGAIGNLIDRLAQPPAFGVGHVIDFIDYFGAFVGNVADIWIVLGALWLAVAVSMEFPEALAGSQKRSADADE